MLLEIIIGLIALMLLWDYQNTRRRGKAFAENGFKGPSTLPVLGCAHNFLNVTPETVFDKIEYMRQRYGKIFRVWFVHEAVLVVTNVKMLEAILSSQEVITKNKLYDLLHCWLGGGLLLSTDKKWHIRRKIISPTFHFKILEQFVEIFDQQSGVMVKKLYEKADGKTVVNIFPMVCLTALDIVADIFVFSISVAEITSLRFVKPYLRFDFCMWLLEPGLYKKQKVSIASMHNFTDNIITERRAALQKSIEDDSFKMEQKSEIGTKKRMVFLDVLLQSTVAGSSLTNEDIREEVDTFMFEGHDTTTSGISYTLYLIARHADVQEKLFQEIRAVIGDDKQKPITMRQLQELKYLECVIKESLRLYPPVPVIGRYVTEDVVLDGKLLPAGTNLTLSFYHILRDSDYFHEPLSFKPERFEADATAKIDPFAYVPFSAGPRNCVGQKFAILEMKSTVSKMLRHFELLPLGEQVRPLLNLILRSANGMQLGLKPRVY